MAFDLKNIISQTAEDYRSLRTLGFSLVSEQHSMQVSDQSYT
jgi:hypothetical protein